MNITVDGTVYPLCQLSLTQISDLKELVYERLHQADAEGDSTTAWSMLNALYHISEHIWNL